MNSVDGIVVFDDLWKKFLFATLCEWEFWVEQDGREVGKQIVDGGVVAESLAWDCARVYV